jgi:4-hydroxy-tetrahydrodipicolinate reductase
MSRDDLKILISGASGRMGRTLIKMISESPDLKLSGALERKDSPAIGKDAGEISGAGPAGVPVSSDTLQCVVSSELIIDFSGPEGVKELAPLAAQNRKPLIVGVTGLGEDILQGLRDASQKIPLLHAPNMSLGVNLTYKIAEEMASRLGEEYEIEIVEAHHNRKKDAPSGTALALFERLKSARGLQEDAKKLGRAGLTGPRNPKEIGIHAIRAGNITGDHTVIFAGPGEVLELTHRAQSREAFATGALKAARWIVGKSPGLYSFAEVLGI